MKLQMVRAGNSACPPAAGPKGPFFMLYTFLVESSYCAFICVLTRSKVFTIDLHISGINIALNRIILSHIKN